LSFCIAVLGRGDRQAVVDLLARRADHLTPPFRLFFCCKRDIYENERDLADAILLQCQFFAMQFVFFRPVTTIAMVVLGKYEYYGPWADGPNDYRAPQFYVTLIQNLSIFIAFTGLLKFYHAVDKDLEWYVLLWLSFGIEHCIHSCSIVDYSRCRPFAKFLCIKGVVFMTFWQGLAITVLAEATDVGGNNAEEWALSAQNFLICLEMLLFSIAHFYCFPTDEWEENYRANFNKAKFGDSIALGDFFADLKLIMKGNTKKKKKQPSEPTVPEGDEENEDDSTEEEQANLDDDADNLNEDASSVTSELTAGTSCDLEDPKRVFASVIGRSSKSDLPEMEDARERILASGFLNDMLFMSPAQQSQSDQERGDAAENALPQTEAQTSRHADYGTRAEAYEQGEEEDGEEATEQTGLLSSGQAEPSPLRPSIFTTIADMEKSSQKDSQQGL
jgi:hypothetical protein